MHLIVNDTDLFHRHQHQQQHQLTNSAKDKWLPKNISCPEHCTLHIAHCTDNKSENLTCGWVARTPESNSLLSRSCRTYLEKWRKGIVLIWLVVNFVSITNVVVTIIILKSEDLTTAALAFSPSASGSTRLGRSDTWGRTLWGWQVICSLLSSTAI